MVGTPGVPTLPISAGSSTAATLEFNDGAKGLQGGTYYQLQFLKTDGSIAAAVADCTTAGAGSPGETCTLLAGSLRAHKVVVPLAKFSRSDGTAKGGGFGGFQARMCNSASTCSSWSASSAPFIVGKPEALAALNATGGQAQITVEFT